LDLLLLQAKVLSHKASRRFAQGFQGIFLLRCAKGCDAKDPKEDS
jgi:hypothetical protein